MNRVISLRLSSILGLVILFSIGLHAQDEPNFQLAYEYLRNRDICLINMDGTGNTCLTDTDDVIEHNPIWSPDGQILTYSSVDEPVSQSVYKTYLYDVATKTAIQFPKPWNILSWSADSETILAMNRDDRQLYNLSRDGSKQERLTFDSTSNFHASWSPNGQEFVYLSGYPKTSLRIMPDSGGSYRVLNDTLDIDGFVAPQWSPDGQTIAFSAYDGEQPSSGDISEIYIVQSDGSNLRQLTFTDGINWEPRWSPDGKQLIFWGSASGAFDDMGSTTSLRTEVFHINADGSNLVNLTQSTGLDYQPEWSPDGQWIAFASTRQGPGIYIMRPDGSDIQMVTNEPPFSEGGRESNNPVWRPVGGG